MVHKAVFIITLLTIIVQKNSANKAVYVRTSNVNLQSVLSYREPVQRELFWEPWNKTLVYSAYYNLTMLPIIDVQQGLLIPQPSTSRCFRLVPGARNEKRVQVCYCFEITVSEIVMLVYNSSSREIIDANQPSKKMCLEIGLRNAAILSSNCLVRYKLQAIN